jgi:hypothetical protein
MGYPYRCNNRSGSVRAHKEPCGYRKTLSHLVHDKECPKCGSEMRHDVKRRAWSKAANCYCGGVYGSGFSSDWPHQRGGLGCEHYTGDINIEALYYQATGGA